ncbi:MAG: hypothetical protein ABI354_02535 [Candidatus Saccharimonadales bacterium]
MTKLQDFLRPYIQDPDVLAQKVVSDSRGTILAHPERAATFVRDICELSNSSDGIFPARLAVALSLEAIGVAQNIAVADM